MVVGIGVAVHQPGVSLSLGGGVSLSLPLLSAVQIGVAVVGGVRVAIQAIGGMGIRMGGVHNGSGVLHDSGGGENGGFGISLTLLSGLNNGGSLLGCGFLSGGGGNGGKSHIGEDTLSTGDKGSSIIAASGGGVHQGVVDSGAVDNRGMHGVGVHQGGTDAVGEGGIGLRGGG